MHLLNESSLLIFDFMIDKKICEKKALDSLKYVWLFLERQGNAHRDSVASSAMLASLMYLLKKDALRIKHNADWQKDCPFVQIDSNFIYMVDPEMLKQWNANGFETIAMCSMLPEDDVLYDVVNRNLSNLYNVGLTKNAIEVIKDAIEGKIAPEQYLSFLDASIQQPRDTFAFTQPKEFAELAKLLIDVKGKSVFNPFSGIMSFATEFDGYSKYTGIEYNQTTYDLGKLRLVLADKTSSASAFCGDVAEWIGEKYDVIVANPPLGMRMQMRDEIATGVEDSAAVAMRRFENSTTSEGQMLTFVAPGMLFSTTNSNLREELTQKNYLDAVIMLPEGILSYTSIRVAVIVLKKNREANAPIKMIDATKMFTGTKSRVLNVEEIYKAYCGETDCALSVRADEIAKKLYSWDASFYNDEATETFKEGFDVVALSDILVLCRGKRQFDDTEGRCVKVGNLSSDWTNYNLHVEDIEVSDALRNTQKIVSPVVLLASVGKHLKASYCEASEEMPIFINSSVSAYTLAKPNVHIGYLCMELSKKDIQTTGLIPHINQELLALVKIGFPPLAVESSFNQQENLYEGAKTEMLLSKARELGLQEVIDRQKEEYINEIRSRKHDMMPHLRQLSSARKNMEHYISHKDEFSEEEYVDGMKEELVNQQKAIDSLSELLAVFTRESRFGTPEKINIDQYLMDYCQYLMDYCLDGNNYSVDYTTDYEAISNYGINIPEELYQFEYGKANGTFRTPRPEHVEGIYVNIATDDLKRLCDNIVFNAVKHGFSDASRNDYRIDIRLTVDMKRDMYQIDFKNNGTPLPKGMDKSRYGIRGGNGKAGKTAGSGEGGYIVKSIVENYGGDYDIYSETEGHECLTTVSVLLPIYRDNE